MAKAPKNPAPKPFDLGALIANGAKNGELQFVGTVTTRLDPRLEIIAALSDIPVEERETVNDIFKLAMNDSRLIFAAGLLITLTVGDGSLGHEDGWKLPTDEDRDYIKRRGFYNTYETLKLGLPFFLNEIENLRMNYESDSAVAYANLKDMLVDRYKIFSETDFHNADGTANLSTQKLCDLLGQMTDDDITHIRQKIEKEEYTQEDIEYLSKQGLETPLDLVAFLGASRLGIARDMIVAGKAADSYSSYLASLRKDDYDAAALQFIEAAEMFKEAEERVAEIFELFLTYYADQEALKDIGKAAVIADPAKVITVLNNEPHILTEELAEVKGVVQNVIEISDDYHAKKAKKALIERITGKKEMRKGAKKELEKLMEHLTSFLRPIDDQASKMTQIEEIQKVSAKFGDPVAVVYDDAYRKLRFDQIFAVRAIEIRLDKLASGVQVVLDEITKQTKAINAAIKAEDDAAGPKKPFDRAAISKAEADKNTLQAYSDFEDWAKRNLELLRKAQEKSSVVGQKIESKKYKKMMLDRETGAEVEREVGKGVDTQTLAMVAVARVLSDIKKASPTIIRKAEIIEAAVERQTAACRA